MFKKSGCLPESSFYHWLSAIYSDFVVTDGQFPTMIFINLCSYLEFMRFLFLCALETIYSVFSVLVIEVAVIEYFFMCLLIVYILASVK